MKPTNCNNPSCGKELIHTEGRRPKKYCDAKCRISAHLKEKKKPKFVRIETHNKLKEELQVLKSKIDYKTPTESSYDGKELKNITYDEHPQYVVQKPPRTLDELKALCPKELTGFERSQWIANKRQEYGI